MDQIYTTLSNHNSLIFQSQDFASLMYYSPELEDFYLIKFPFTELSSLPVTI